MAIITFNDIHGVEQTLDTRQKFNVAFNADCMDILRAMPDKCIDLIVADPPYGDGNPDNEDEHRNQRGRFDRYNESSQSVQVEREREATPKYNRFGNPGSRFERYKEASAPIPRRREERPVEEVPSAGRHIMSTGGGGTASTSTGMVARTGGTWAEKYGKKS